MCGKLPKVYVIVLSQEVKEVVNWGHEFSFPSTPPYWVPSLLQSHMYVGLSFVRLSQSTIESNVSMQGCTMIKVQWLQQIILVWKVYASIS